MGFTWSLDFANARFERPHSVTVTVRVTPTYVPGHAMGEGQNAQLNAKTQWESEDASCTASMGASWVLRPWQQALRG